MDMETYTTQELVRMARDARPTYRTQNHRADCLLEFLEANPGWWKTSELTKALGVSGQVMAALRDWLVQLGLAKTKTAPRSGGVNGRGAIMVALWSKE